MPSFFFATSAGCDAVSVPVDAEGSVEGAGLVVVGTGIGSGVGGVTEGAGVGFGVYAVPLLVPLFEVLCGFLIFVGLTAGVGSASISGSSSTIAAVSVFRLLRYIESFRKTISLVVSSFLLLQAERIIALTIVKESNVFFMIVEFNVLEFYFVFLFA